MCDRGRPGRPETFVSSGAIPPPRGTRSSGVPGGPRTADPFDPRRPPARRPPASARCWPTGSLAREPADGPGDRQPGLAAPLRPGDRPLAEQFGRQGDRPTHPELLDWLATEFVSEGWRLKQLHRLIVTSNAYRMSSRANPEALAKDPANDSLWRFDMRRLTAEEIRDSVLAVGGTLNLKMYGPGIYPEIPREVLAGQSAPRAGWGSSPSEEQARRSVYIHVKRSLMTPILESFDAAETDRSTPSASPRRSRRRP